MCDLHSCDAHSILWSEVFLGDPNAIISAEKVANHIELPWNVSDIWVHILHLKLQPVQCFGVHRGQRHNRFVVR